MLKLIVFDCDGVMFDSKPANIAYYNSLLNHFSLPAMDDSEEEFVHMNSVTESVKHIFRHYQQPTIARVNEVRQQISYDPFLKYMRIEPDLIEFLELTHTKYHLAISTNRTNTMLPLLDAYGLKQYFAKVVTAHTATRPKPAPDGLLEILDHFGCTAEQAIFIGDSTIDEQHAASCDVPLVAFKSPRLHAAYHVTCFMELFNLPPFKNVA